jgi:hypothetical protein
VVKERKQQMKNKADRSKHEPSFTVGDIVYVYRPVVTPGRQKKFISISINSGGVKSALRAQVSALHEMMWLCKCFPYCE